MVRSLTLPQSQFLVLGVLLHGQRQWDLAATVSPDAVVAQGRSAAAAPGLTHGARDATRSRRRYPKGWGQSVRYDDGPTQWKAIRVDNGPMLLFNLTADIGEFHNISSEHPDTVDEIVKMMEQSHEDSKFWPSPKGQQHHQCCPSCFKPQGCSPPCFSRKTSQSPAVTPPPPGAASLQDLLPLSRCGGTAQC